MNRWKKVVSKLLFKTPYYKIEQDSYSHPEVQGDINFYTFNCRDWVNIIALDRDHPLMEGAQLLWIRQYRAGTGSVTLEIPGGTCDPEDNELSSAARRELQEETGAVPTRMVYLGSFSPNPAVFKNRVHTYLALGCRVDSALKGGDDTEFIEIEWRPFAQRFEHLLDPESHHALTAAALALLEARLHSNKGVI